MTVPIHGSEGIFRVRASLCQLVSCDVTLSLPGGLCHCQLARDQIEAQGKDVNEEDGSEGGCLAKW